MASFTTFSFENGVIFKKERRRKQIRKSAPRVEFSHVVFEQNIHEVQSQDAIWNSNNICEWRVEVVLSRLQIWAKGIVDDWIQMTTRKVIGT